MFVRLGATWSQQSKLVASDGVPDDRFGSSVAVYDYILVVGAYAASSGSGTFVLYCVLLHCLTHVLPCT